MIASEHQPPIQERSRLTELALIDAAIRLFQLRGMDAVTMTDIATEAGVSPASINRRFGDKNGLERRAFRTFIDRALSMVGAMEPADSTGSLIDLLAQISMVVLRFSSVNQGYLQSAYARALVSEEYATGIRELRTGVLSLLRAHILRHVDEISHPDPSLAVEFVLHQAMAMVSARTDFSKVEVGLLDEYVFFHELLLSLLGYLQVDCNARQIEEAMIAQGFSRAEAGSS